MSLSIANVIRVFILAALRGLANANTSALALFTDEEPLSATYGDYGIYLDPTGVASDFGSTSKTYRLAVKVFQQVPNILTGSGFLVIIPRNQTAAAQPATIVGTSVVNFTSLTADDYYIKVAVDGGAVTSLDIGEIDTTDMTTILTSLNSTAVTAAGLVFTISGDKSSAVVTLKTIATGASKSIAIDSGVSTYDGTELSPLVFISGSATGSDAGVERVKDAVLRTVNFLEYFGIILNKKQTDDNLTELAALIQCYDKMLFVGSNLTADITGIFSTLMGSGYTHTRCLFYSNSENDALDFAAAYASRGLSINFDASNSVHTMHLKDITGLDADPIFAGSTGQTYLDSAKNNGVDVLADFGIAKVFTSGQNGYFDAIYIQLALRLRLQVAGFNYLAQTNTKIPQTEEGMDGLKGAYRKVMGLFVTNGAFAPGTWNSSTTFGDPEDHIRNISDYGYFIYSSPVALQSQTVREARVAPIAQIAAKSSGAIHSSDVIVLIEA
jgi:hypothetical protein